VRQECAWYTKDEYDFLKAAVILKWLYDGKKSYVRFHEVVHTHYIRRPTATTVSNML
jgi:hypothetical protein